MTGAFGRIRLLTIVTGLVLLVPLPGCAQDRPAEAGAAADPVEALQTGDYEAAAQGFQVLARNGNGLPGTARGWARALAATGEYEDALDALDGAVSAGANAADLADIRGEMLQALGRSDEAEQALRTSDTPLARLGLAELLWNTGRRSEAEPIFDSFIDVYNASSNLSWEELGAVGRALTYLGAENSDLFHDAVRAYEEAIEADPGEPTPKVRLAELFLDKFDSRNAGSLLDEAIARNPRHAPALFAKAKRAKFDGSSESFEFVRAALEVNPRFADALAFLSYLHLEIDQLDQAESEAREALDTNPVSLPAWTALAAAAQLGGDEDGFTEARDRVLGIDPQHAQVYVTLEHLAYRTRRYADAAEFAAMAVALDPNSWAGHAALGLNQLRLGQMEEGRVTLETAFAGDPFNLWVKNTLDLLDELDKFDTVTSPRFVFRMHPDESAILSVYAPLLAEEAYDALAARYGYEPPGPLTLEMYDRHADFSVRTFGLAGIGALGVSFGSVLAMDSPGARPGGHFNWGSTLWHETSHAFALGYTEHKIPRWFAEGLAVLDERRARPGWGSDVDPGFLQAFADDRLPPLDGFDSGFVRPTYPAQIMHSYFLASLLCEMIEDRYGIEAIREMLDGYRDGRATPSVFRTALGASVRETERDLHAYIRARYGSALDALADESFQARLQEAAALREAGRTEAAITELEAARDMFPEYVGPGSPILAIARLNAERGDDATAIEAYRDYASMNENDLEARLEQAGLERRTGDLAGMQRTLESSLWIDPFGLDAHARLAEASEVAGDWTQAVTERRALLALEPTDQAAAWYHLARALHGAGEPTNARRAVMEALNIAPSYEEALELLLQISEGGR